MAASLRLFSVVAVVAAIGRPARAHQHRPVWTVPHRTARHEKCAAVCEASGRVTDVQRDDDAGLSFITHHIHGDGRCLFRAVSTGMALRTSGVRLNEEAERVEADRLRLAAVEELSFRRAETEWFIEGDFPKYCATMRNGETWGGEPEILMLTHVLRQPIEVFVPKPGGGIRSIAHYGVDDYGDDGLAILWNGVGHYETLSRCAT